jgi:hypothetical protein
MLGHRISQWWKIFTLYIYLQSMVLYLIGKLNTAVFMISSLMKRLDQKSLLMVYYAYAYSYMQYSINIWRCSTAVMKAVFVAQKRLIRALAGERFWPADSPLC